MLTNAELLIEGSYMYYQQGANYSQEDFRLLEMADEKGIIIISEILSRIETGEFLKIKVHFEANMNHVPYFVKTVKSIGSRHAVETYTVDHATQTLLYEFEGQEGKETFEKPFNTKHYLGSEAFATSAFFTLSKRFDATGRTPVIILNSANEWSYEGPPAEKLIYAQFLNREANDLVINNQNLSASHLRLFDHDSANDLEAPVDVFVSKHYAIPYRLSQGDLRIDIRSLKKYR